MTKRSRKIPFEKARPVGGRVKVMLEPPERLSDIIEMVEDNRDKEALAKEWGIIVEMGDDAFSDNSPNPDKRIKVGDLAIFGRYSGRGTQDPNNKDVYYRWLSDVDIDSVIDKEELDSSGYNSEYAKVGIKEVSAAIKYAREAK